MSTPAYSDFHVKAPVPIDRRLYADTVNDLTSFTTAHNFENMVVFVRDVKKFYYLITDATGSALSDWQEMQGGSGTGGNQFIAYDAGIPYTEIGLCVSVGTDMFISISDTIATGEDPINNPDKWLRVAGSNYIEFIGTDITTTTISHNIDNPRAYIYIGNQIVEASTEYNTGEVLITFSEEIPNVKIVIR